MSFRTTLLRALALTALAAPAASAGTSAFYVGRDSRATLGTPPAPNENLERLTFLFNHGDHFHSLGRIGGPEGRVPESYIGGAIRMAPVAGGGFAVQPYDDASDPTSEYSHLEIRDIHSLDDAAPGSSDFILYNSSAQRWNTLGLDDAVVAMELVSISGGLRLASGDLAQTADAAGERIVLGPGAGFAAPFTFFTDGNAQLGQTFEALIKLVDIRTNGTPFGESGNIRFVLQAVPEPSSLILAGAGAIGLVVVGRRGRRRALAS